MKISLLLQVEEPSTARVSWKSMTTLDMKLKVVSCLIKLRAVWELNQWAVQRLVVLWTMLNMVNSLHKVITEHQITRAMIWAAITPRLFLWISKQAKIQNQRLHNTQLKRVDSYHKQLAPHLHIIKCLRSQLGIAEILIQWMKQASI